MLLFPLFLSLVSLRKKGVKPLKIDQSKTRNPRYFGESFAALIEKAWLDYDGSGQIKLSHIEKILEADKTNTYPDNCQSVIYAETEDFRPPENVIFEKEIYSCQDAYIEGNTLRALYGKRSIVLGEGTNVIRWVDGEGLLCVNDNCNLGISASSAYGILLGKNCFFRRLYAPEIRLGCTFVDNQLQETRDTNVEDILGGDVKLNEDILRNVKYVSKNDGDENGIINATIISKHTVILLEGVVVKGHVRSHKSVVLKDRAIVYGNIFAEGDIYLGEGSRVCGNIFTQESFEAERNVFIGRWGEIKSVIARGKITFGENCRVFGYISSEDQGLCVPDVEKLVYDREEEGNFSNIDVPFWKSNKFFPPSSIRRIDFASAEEFDNINYSIFRKNKRLKEVIIPEGVKKIRPSFFYGCSNLIKIGLPGSLEEISNFAFFDCKSLKEIDFGECAGLRVIGESAFENCSALEKVVFGPSLQRIGEAAFSGCTDLREADFSGSKLLAEIPSHIFLRCENLAKIKLPPAAKKIGVSAFNNCRALSELTLPAKLEQVDNFAFTGCTNLKELKILSPFLNEEDLQSKGMEKNTKLTWEI
jgi:cytoskeletal protein CcmA (bactofilin family)